MFLGVGLLSACLGMFVGTGGGGQVGLVILDLVLGLGLWVGGRVDTTWPVGSAVATGVAGIVSFIGFFFTAVFAGGEVALLIMPSPWVLLAAAACFMAC
jgi:hypothetical protein